MKLFNNHSGSRGLPRFIKGLYWATSCSVQFGLFLTTPFTEGCAGANKKASPPSRQQEQASKQRCTFSQPHYVQFSSVHGIHGIWLGLFYFFDHYIISGEVIGFRLFRATGLAYIQSSVHSARVYLFGLYWVFSSFLRSLY